MVIISNSGRTRDLMDACDIARKNGATTIVITASGSPLAAAGHIHLAADHPEGYDRYSPMVSRLLHLMIIDILATCVALRIGGSKLQPLLQGDEEQPAEQAVRVTCALRTAYAPLRRFASSPRGGRCLRLGEPKPRHPWLGHATGHIEDKVLPAAK